MENTKPVTRKELALLIVNYVSHAKRITETSDKTFYKTVIRGEALRFGRELVRLANNEYSSIFELCRFTLMLKTHLYILLPCTTNKSYESSKSNLEKILNICQLKLQPPKPIMQPGMKSFQTGYSTAS